MIKQILPHNVYYSTTLLWCWKEWRNSNVRGLKENWIEKEGLWRAACELAESNPFSTPLRWVRPKQAGSQREKGSRRLVAPFMKVRTPPWPHQEAEGTRRTRRIAVHVRLRGRQCTEHWLLFARTPKESKWMRGESIQRWILFLMLNYVFNIVVYISGACSCMEIIFFLKGGKWVVEYRDKEENCNCL